MSMTRKDLGRFPADAIPELPLLAMRCGCGLDVYPFDQARAPSAVETIMQLCHYECQGCGRVWGRSYPITDQRGLIS